MTTKEAVSIIQRQMRSIIFELIKDNDREMAQVVDTAWIHVREAALECTCNMENRPNDEGKTDKGMFVPEGPKGDEMSDFKNNVDKSLNDLNRSIMQCETDIEMLWNAVEKIKEKLPREWK